MNESGANEGGTARREGRTGAGGRRGARAGRCVVLTLLLALGFAGPIPAQSGNQPPVANAGGSRAVVEGDAVFLEGYGFDPEGGRLSYRWTQTGGPAAPLRWAAKATARFVAPTELSVDETLVFELTVTDAGGLSATDAVEVQVAPFDPGDIRTVAGPGRLRDGRPATSARLDHLTGVAVDGAGNVYVADAGRRRVRRIDTAGVIETVAGTGEWGDSGDGGPATAARLSLPRGVAVDGAGNVYVADEGSHRVRRIDTAGVIETVAGTGESGDSGDGGPATAARLISPWDVAVDGAGGVYVADAGSHRVRRIDASGVIETVAGTGEQGDSGDGGPATAARLASPWGVAVDGAGGVYVADTWNHSVRWIDASGVIETVAGTGLWGDSGDGGPATAARLNSPSGVAVDGAGNVYVADSGSRRVRRIDASGVIETVAGTGERGDSGDGGPATTARLSLPRGVAVDGAGNVYVADESSGRVRRIDAAGVIEAVAGIGKARRSEDVRGVAMDSAGNVYVADTENHRVRRIDPTGLIETVAGTGERGYSGDGGPATAARLDTPRGVAVDGVGGVYVADTGNHRVRRIDASGVIETVAGTGRGGYSGDGGPATAARLDSPWGVAADGAGGVYVADAWNGRVRRIDASGVIETVAGTGEWGRSGDGGPATAARLAIPYGVAADGAGGVYVADTWNHSVRWIDASGVIETVAGTGARGDSGDGGPATAARLDFPVDVAADGIGGVYVADTGSHRVRRIDASGVIETVAGTGARGYSGDGRLATAARLSRPYGVAVDGAGGVYVADAGNRRVRRIDASGVIDTVAGVGAWDDTGDGGPATAAWLDFPWSVAVDGAGNVYVADSGSHRVRRIDASGVIDTVAGTGEQGDSGDGGPATAARLDSPSGVAVDGAGNVYVADEGSHRVRRIDTAGDIETVAGIGAGGDSGDGGPATAARLYHPFGVSVDGAGNVYVADRANHRVRRINASGVIETMAGTGEWGFSGDGGPATAARLRSPFGVAVDGAGNVYVADTENDRVRRIDASGVIETVAGIWMRGDSGDGGPATAARLSRPYGVAVDGAGNVYVADTWNDRVRRIDASGVIETVAGVGEQGDSGDGGPATAARLSSPYGVAVDGAGNVYVADRDNDRVRLVRP